MLDMYHAASAFDHCTKVDFECCCMALPSCEHNLGTELPLKAQKLERGQALQSLNTADVILG